jgi:hypothetical protein
MDDKQRLQILSDTFPDLDGWYARTAGQPEEPQNGSELFKDDKVFPWHRISETARLSLALSVEHLRLIRVMLDARQTFPSAPFTTLRGALVGAAQAVWILSPEDAGTRRRRGLTVIAEEYMQLAKFYREAERLYDPSPIPSDQWQWLNERQGELEKARGSDKTALNQTNMIGDVLDFAYPSEPEKRRTGRLLWRQMSSDAHVLGWGVAQRGTVSGPPPKGASLAVHAAAGTLEHLMDPFLCSFELTRRGWSLFDRRCQAP